MRRITRNSAKAIENENGSTESSINARNGEGVVHGHIHNYDNVTYIHGHVHHGHYQDNSDIPSSLVEPHDDWESSSFPQAMKTEDPFCSEYGNCEHFEFVNYHASKQMSKTSSNNVILDTDNSPNKDSSPHYANSENPIQGADQMLTLVSRKRTFSDSIGNVAGESNPKILEVCCDMDHAPSSIAAQEEFLGPCPLVSQDEFVFPASTKNSTTAPGLTRSESISKREPLDINCDLSCICPQLSHHNPGDKDGDKDAEDDILQKFYKNVNSNQQKLQETSLYHHNHSNHRHYQHHQHHFHDQRNIQQSSNDSNDKYDYHNSSHTVPPTSSLNEHSQGENKMSCCSHSSSSIDEHPTIYKDHVDLKVLGDLYDISSLYDYPLASHMNHYNHSHAHTHTQEQTNQDLDLLQSTMGATDGVRSSATHHHHRIQFYQDGYPYLAWDQDGKIPSNDKLENEQTSTLPHSCGPRFGSSGNLETEMNTINFNWFFKNEESDNLKCEWDKCPEQFPSLIDLQKHMFKTHVPQEEVASNLLCNWNECQFKGDDVCSLINHINSDHGINFGMKVLDNAPSLEKKDHYLLHCDGKQEESADSSHKCTKLHCLWDDCNQFFFTPEDLSNHLEKFHLPRGKSEYYCYWRDCSRKFTQRQKMVRHLKVHSGYKPYRCHVCSKFFSSEDTLNQHMRTHSGEKPFKCHLCDKRFSVSSSLKIHIRTHTGEKPLQCKICAKRFNESSNLNKHLKTHRKKYKCGFCARSFDTEEKFKSHQFTCCHSPSILTQKKL